MEYYLTWYQHPNQEYPGGEEFTPDKDDLILEAGREVFSKAINAKVKIQSVLVFPTDNMVGLHAEPPNSNGGE